MTGSGVDVDVAVVGGGPAGLSCALTAAAHGLTVTIVESTALGGQLLNVAEFESFPGYTSGTSGYDLAATLSDQVMDAGAAISFGAVTALDRVATRWQVSGDGFEAIDAAVVVLATGSSAVPLGVPAESRLAGGGISECAACDGPLFRGRKVVVIGGGEHAVHEALHLASTASQVTVITVDESGLPPAALESRIAGRTNVRTVRAREIRDILGSQRVSGVAYVDPQGAPVEIDAEAVFVAGRRVPESRLAAAHADLDDHGHVLVDGVLASSSRTLLGAGDVRTASATSVLGALADGDRAGRTAFAVLADPPVDG